MTRKEIEAMRNRLPRLCDVPFSKWSDYQKRLSSELSCREMINSCLCYGGIEGFWRKFDSFPEGWYSYADKYIDELGEERVKELVMEQEYDFEHAVVTHNVYTDDEGLSYNAIRWADEDVVVA